MNKLWKIGETACCAGFQKYPEGVFGGVVLGFRRYFSDREKQIYIYLRFSLTEVNRLPS